MVAGCGCWPRRITQADRGFGRPAEAGHELAITDSAGEEVWAAPADVAHILDNLLENAIRYSPRGARIEVRLDRNSGRPGFVVADTGPGIAPEERAHVFERFYRGTEGRSAGPGTGLGLAIVAELAERWDGRVELLDGPGTRVRTTFPAAPTDSSPPANHS